MTIGDKVGFTPGKWYELRFEWRNVMGKKTGTLSGNIYLDNIELADKRPLTRKTINGISYIHFISSDEMNLHRFLISRISFTQTLSGQRTGEQAPASDRLKGPPEE